MLPSRPSNLMKNQILTNEMLIACEKHSNVECQRDPKQEVNVKMSKCLPCTRTWTFPVNLERKKC